MISKPSPTSFPAGVNPPYNPLEVAIHQFLEVHMEIGMRSLLTKVGTLGCLVTIAASTKMSESHFLKPASELFARSFSGG